MTKPQAKRWAYRIACKLLDRFAAEERGNAAYDTLPKADQDRLDMALEEVADELGKRGRLGAEAVRGVE